MEKPAHFKNKDAIEHVAEAHAEGILASTEIHGTETPGRISAAADSLRDCSVTLLLSWGILIHIEAPEFFKLKLFAVMAISLMVWKAGRSAWLGWARLERLHRVLEQEHYEIQHHRQQEREELGALYASKGFQGKLLEDVLDVLMADGDRLLRVMVQEELGLSLEAYDHPLLQSIGAFLGSLIAGAGSLLAYWIFPSFGVAIAAFIFLNLGTIIAAWHVENKLIPAIIWNSGLLAITFGTFYFLMDYIKLAQ